MSKFLSPTMFRKLLDNSAKATKRFPVSLAFSVALTAYAIGWICNGYTPFFSQIVNYFFVLWLVYSIPFSMAVTLFAEDMPRRISRIAVTVGCNAALALLCADTAYFQTASFYSGYSEMAIAIVSIVALFAAPFLRQRHPNDIPLWNFSSRIIGAVAISYAIALLLMLGIFLLLASFYFLFGIDFSDKAFFITAAVCHLLLAPMLIMQLVPQGDAKRDPKPVLFSSFGKSATHYLFMPLVAAYLVTLYVYAAKIIVSWELPCGWVSWLVTGLMASSILLIAVLYPMLFNGQSKRIDTDTARFLPLLIMPMLVLMSIAICRRISDYGVTTARVYVVIFNLWCYAVCIYMFVTRSRRTMPVITSFAVIALLTTINPVSVNDFVCRNMASQLKQSMLANGVTKLPINNEQYHAYINRLPQATKQEVGSKMDYLKYHHNSFNSLCDSTVETDFVECEFAVRNAFICDNFIETSEFTVPAGAKTMVAIDTTLNATISDINGATTTYIPFTQHTSLGDATFRISLKQLQQICNSNVKQPFLTISNGGNTLVISSFNYQANKKQNGKTDLTFRFWGYLFMTQAKTQTQPSAATQQYAK
ncbi:MAG: DUF4153 domain-containing protein [Sodaliphilus sp.]|nr:DUF4153 domain-containing protein [Sodaliphilus sp.]